VFRYIFGIFMLLAGTQTFAQISVSGRIYSKSSCDFSYESYGDFKIAYSSSHLKEVEKVEVIAGFYNTWGAKSFASLRSVVAQKVSESNFQATFNSVQVRSSRKFAFNAINFVIQITHKDGTQIWYRPSDENSYFSAKFPDHVECVAGEFQSMIIDHL
jgi:hypothetical protein